MGGSREKPHPSEDGAVGNAAGAGPATEEGATEEDINPGGRVAGGGGGGGGDDTEARTCRGEGDLVTVATGSVRRIAEADVTNRPTGTPDTQTWANE